MKSSFEFDQGQQVNKRNVSFATKKLTLLSPITLTDFIAPADTIIFMHVPKTGGTNLCFMAKALSKIRQEFKVTRFSVPRIPNYSPGITYEGWKGGFESALNTIKKNKHYCDELNFISGHFPFGLHEFINNDAKYITLIRDPMERSISSTNFDYQRGYVLDENAYHYLRELEIDNPQTRMLSGCEFMSGECNEAVLEQAKKNIEAHFLLVGITEDTNTFIQALIGIQNWESFAMVKSQVTGKKIITLSSELREELSAKHSYDLRLYAWAKERWIEWKKQYLNSKSRSIDEHEKIICITSDFANTKKPLSLSRREIEAFNNELDEDTVIEISQNHDIVAEYKAQNKIYSDSSINDLSPVYMPYRQSVTNDELIKERAQQNSEQQNDFIPSNLKIKY